MKSNLGLEETRTCPLIRRSSFINSTTDGADAAVMLHTCTWEVRDSNLTNLSAISVEVLVVFLFF